MLRSDTNMSMALTKVLNQIYDWEFFLPLPDVSHVVLYCTSIYARFYVLANLSAKVVLQIPIGFQEFQCILLYSMGKLCFLCKFLQITWLAPFNDNPYLDSVVPWTQNPKPFSCMLIITTSLSSVVGEQLCNLDLSSWSTPTCLW